MSVQPVKLKCYVLMPFSAMRLAFAYDYASLLPSKN